MTKELKDIQKTPDHRRVHIDRVGVSNIKLPMRVKLKQPMLNSEDSVLPTVATINMSVSLDSQIKGTHMSRFSEILHEFNSFAFSLETVQKIQEAMLARIGGLPHIEVMFDFFFDQKAPETNRGGIAPCRVGYISHLRTHEGGFLSQVLRQVLEIEGKTCCPCSKEISDFDESTGRGKGAHAQRSKVTIDIEVADPKHYGVLWFEDMILMAQDAFSSPVYPVLKRPDERRVTMSAYENPKFVEDVIRDVVVAFRSDKRVVSGDVKVVNAESIHYHDAFAITSFTHQS